MFHMMYLVKPDGAKVPIVITGQDGKSLKISNFQGDSRWIKYTDFVLKDNLLIIKE